MPPTHTLGLTVVFPLIAPPTHVYVKPAGAPLCGTEPDAFNCWQPFAHVKRNGAAIAALGDAVSCDTVADTLAVQPFVLFVTVTVYTPAAVTANSGLLPLPLPKFQLTPPEGVEPLASRLILGRLHSSS